MSGVVTTTSVPVSDADFYMWYCWTVSLSRSPAPAVETTRCCKYPRQKSASMNRGESSLHTDDYLNTTVVMVALIKDFPCSDSPRGHQQGNPVNNRGHTGKG